MEDDDFFLPDTCPGTPAYRNMHSHRNSPTRSRNNRTSTSTRISTTSTSSSRRRTTASVSATLSQTDSNTPHPPGLRRQSANAHDFFTGAATPDPTIRHISNLTGVSSSTRLFTANYSLGPTPTTTTTSTPAYHNNSSNDIPGGYQDADSPTSSFTSSTASFSSSSSSSSNSSDDTENTDPMIDDSGNVGRFGPRPRETPFGGPPPIPPKELVEYWIRKYGYSNGLDRRRRT